MINTQIKQVKKSRLRKTLQFSFYDGIFASIMFGCVQDYFTPFLLFINGTILHVGILNAVPNVTASVLQLLSNTLVQIFKSRKTVFCIFVFLQASVLIACAIIFYSFYRIHDSDVNQALGALKYYKIHIFILIVTLYTVFGSMANPAWASLMSDLIPENKRGKYFGFRNSRLGVLLVLASLCTGIALRFSPSELLLETFVSIFCIAGISRFISFYYLTKMHEPPFIIEKIHIIPPHFFQNIKKSEFLTFIAFVSLMNFAVFLSAPFFAVLMLKHLSFSYLEYSIVTISAPLIMYITMHVWGTIADRIGNAKVMIITSPFIALVPLLWVFGTNIVYLFIVQIFSGIIWSGFTISTFNYLFDASESNKRVRYISYFNLINGIMISIGAITGGLLIEILPAIKGHSIYSILITSTLVRILIILFFLKHIKEMRLPLIK